jgi:hypothetical protein
MAAILALTGVGLLPNGSAMALAYDGSNPGVTPCGDGSHVTYDLGLKTSTGGLSADPTPIYSNGVKIGTVELRHSAYCATVWSKVTNLTNGPVDAKETIVLYSDSNGGGRTEYPYPTTDHLTAAGGTTPAGWSNQYRDRASFSAKGAILYNGVWNWVETARVPAWVQYRASIPNNPYACDHTTAHPCERWPTKSPGISATYTYYVHPEVNQLPSGSGTYTGAEADVDFMFGKFNAVPAPSPFFNKTSQNGFAIFVHNFQEPADPVTHLIAISRSGSSPVGQYGVYYSWGEIKFNSLYTGWGPQASMRELLCHEIMHVMGLYHVWEGSLVGSKATCIGMGYATGPTIDDVSALNDVYNRALP